MRMTAHTAMIAYTRRYRRDGSVKVFLRSADGRCRGNVVCDRAGAEAVPPGKPLTIQIGEYSATTSQ